jgi:hypothetical protein
MNPNLQKLTVSQLHDLFMETTLEFVRSLEAQASFSQLKDLRDKIKQISGAIDTKRQTEKTAQESLQSGGTSKELT